MQGKACKTNVCPCWYCRSEMCNLLFALFDNRFHHVADKTEYHIFHFGYAGIEAKGDLPAEKFPYRRFQCAQQLIEHLN